MFKISSRFERAVAIGMIITGLVFVALCFVEYIAVCRHPEFQLNNNAWFALILGMLLVCCGSALIFAQNEVQRAKELRRVVEEEIENLRKLRG